MSAALPFFDTSIRNDLHRIIYQARVADFAFPDDFWERAKQPVRTIGLGLHDLTAVAHINYVAAHGAVARLCKTITAEILEEAPPLSLPKVIQQLQHDAELKINHQKLVDSRPPVLQAGGTIRRRYSQTQPDATQPPCQPMSEIEKWPSQKALCKGYYDARGKELIQEASHDPELKHLLTSALQWGSGEQFKANPASRSPSPSLE